MDYTNTQLTQPASEPVTLAAVKKHLAIDHNEDDDVIADDIRAAREYCEGHTGRVFGQRSFRLKLAAWPQDGQIRFPIEPVVSVTSVGYTDSDDGAQTVSGEWSLWLEHSPPLLVLKSGFAYPSLSIDSPSPVEVEYIAGESDVPRMVAAAIKMIVEYWRANPGGETSLGHLSRGIPAGAIRLLDNLWTGAL